MLLSRLQYGTFVIRSVAVRQNAEDSREHRARRVKPWWSGMTLARAALIGGLALIGGWIGCKALRHFADRQYGGSPHPLDEKERSLAVGWLGTAVGALLFSGAAMALLWLVDR
jgi:hypothetical protein